MLYYLYFKFLLSNYTSNKEIPLVSCTVFQKTLYHINKIKFDSLKRYLFQGLENTLGSSTNLIASKEVEERIIPFRQHFIVYLWGNKEIPYETSYNVCNSGLNINCDSYQNGGVKILTFIEVFLTREFAFLFNEHTSTNLVYHIINPTGFGHMNVYFNELCSKDRTGQKHCDLMIRESGTLKKHYYDIKSYVTVGFSYCRFSGFYSNTPKILKLINIITTSLQRIITENNIPVNHSIYKLNKQIIEQKKHMKVKDPIMMKQLYLEIMEELIPYVLDEQYDLLKIGIAIYLDHDQDFQQYYDLFIKNNREQFERKSIELDNCFPKTPILEDVVYEENVQNLIKQLFSEENAQHFIDNLKNII